MPFSMAEMQKYSQSILQFYIKIPYKKMKKIVTLQVRILAVYLHECAHCHSRKAFLSVPAGMTLEAALVLPLFIFASVSLILPMKIMNTERKIQAGLEAAGEELSQYAYLQDVMMNGEEEQIPGADSYAKDFCKNLAGAAAGIYAQLRVQEHVDTKQVIFMHSLQSSALEDGEMLDLVLNYQIQMPFPVLGLEHISRTARSRRRAWIGREGHDGTAPLFLQHIGIDSPALIFLCIQLPHIRNKPFYLFAENKLISPDQIQMPCRPQPRQRK